MFDPAVHKAFLECRSKLSLVFADRMHRGSPENVPSGQSYQQASPYPPLHSPLG
jgi:hypothetical protein